MVDVRVDDVGAEGLLGDEEARADGAIVGAFDELGVGEPPIAEPSLDLFHVDVPHLLDGGVEFALVAHRVRVEDEV